jgi:hypothetical protein
MAEKKKTINTVNRKPTPFRDGIARRQNEIRLLFEFSGLL